MASEDLAIDQNGRWALGGVTNDASEFIKNLRINPITGRLLVDAHLTSTNTQIGDTIPGGTAGSVLFLDIGSTLAQDNSNFFYDPTNHRLGLGTITPTKTLHIVGTFRLVDGTQGNGYVLTTDGSGNASWANLATNTTTVTQLVDNTTFTTNLAGDTNFTTELIANNTFITNLGGDTTFLTTLQTNVDLILPDQTGNAGKFLYTDGTNASWESVGGGAGTVSSFSFTNANGFTGVVTNPTTTPNLTVTTNQTGVLRGNGTAISAAAADPATDTLFGWDNTDAANKYITIGSGLTYTHATHTLSAIGGSGLWSLLGTTTLGSAAASISVSGFTAKKYLMFELTGKTGADLSTLILMQFNSDTSTHYGSQSADGFGGGASFSNSSSITIFHTRGSGTAAKGYFFIQGEIYNPQTEYKRMTGSGTYTNDIGSGQYSVMAINSAGWSDTTNQITTITCFPNNSEQWEAGAVLNVYGHD